MAVKHMFVIEHAEWARNLDRPDEWSDAYLQCVCDTFREARERVVEHAGKMHYMLPFEWIDPETFVGFKDEDGVRFGVTYRIHTVVKW